MSVRYVRTTELPAGHHVLLVQHGTDVTLLVRADLITAEGAAVLSETVTEAARRWWSADLTD